MSQNWHPAVAAQSQQKRFLRTDQAAARLMLKKRRVRQLCEQGLLLGIKNGRAWLIPESAIDDYLRSLNS